MDGASGAFVWPFLYPDSKWDFRLEQVASINASGHKFGLVYPGIGWLIFRSPESLPEDLIFYEDYLGKRDATFTLNFSTGSAMVLAQYFNFIRFGRSGYEHLMKLMQKNAGELAKGIADVGPFELIGEGEQLPLVAWKLTGDQPYDVFDVASQLAAERGWMVPAYHLPPNAQDVKLMRALVKLTLGYSQAEKLVEDLEDCLRDAREEGRPGRARAQARPHFDRVLSGFAWLRRQPGEADALAALRAGDEAPVGVNVALGRAGEALHRAGALVPLGTLGLSTVLQSCRSGPRRSPRATAAVQSRPVYLKSV